MRRLEGRLFVGASSPSTPRLRGLGFSLLCAGALLAVGCVPKAKPDAPPVTDDGGSPAATPAPSAPPPSTGGDVSVAPSSGSEPSDGGAAPAPAEAAPVRASSTAKGAFDDATKAIARGSEGYRDAAGSLEDAVRIDPAFIQAWFNLGVVRQRLGELNKAQEAYEKTLELNKEFVPGYVNLASVYRSKGNYDKALDLLAKAATYAPTDSSVRNERIAILRATGRTDDAIAEAHKLIAENSNDLNAFVNLALAYHDKGNLDMSRLVYEKAFAAFPTVSDDAHVRHAYGMVLLAQDERDLAIVNGFDKAVKLDPYYVEALINRAQLYLEDSEPKEAVKLLRRAVDQQPTNQPARLTLAVALRRSGDLEAAKSQYEIVLTQNPSSFDALYNLAVLYSNYLQDPAKAKEKFELARKQTNDNELVAELDRYIDEAQRSIEIRERTEKLRQMREQAAKEREAKEAAEKAAQGSGGGDEGGGAPPDEGGSDGDDSGGDEGTGGDEAPAPSEDGGAGGGSPEAGDDAPAE